MSTENAPADRAKVVALDTCVLINFLIVNRMDIFADLSAYRFVVLDAVEAEVRRPRQQAIMAAAFQGRAIVRAGPCTSEELQAFAEHTRIMGRGEAACLSAAQTRGWMIASDERGLFRRTAVNRIGAARVVTTPALLTAAARTGVISHGEIADIVEELARNRFRLRPGTLDEMLSD